MGGPDRSKAAKYIQQLDQAQCGGDWEAVPNLVRKIRKHAPARACLTLAANATHAVQQAIKHRPSTGTNPEITSLVQYVPPLIGAIDEEHNHPEDVFQAQVALGWVHWALGEPELAALRLPKDIEGDFSLLDGTSKQSTGWTRTCALKAIYIKGVALEKSRSPGDAIEVFGSGMPIVSATASELKKASELRKWTELLLTKFCLITSQSIKSNASPTMEAETLVAFRAWADFWERLASSSTAAVGGYATEADVPRRQIWKEYYATLSFIVQKDLPYPTTALGATSNNHGLRIIQRGELARVEARYESLLLKEAHFPKAEQSSEEIEELVGLVLGNWAVLCGNCWDEHDLGSGGRDGISHSVLEILYRASTKTFHSTQILRGLFTVHLALANFELAFKAFDTYFEIVNKGKQRVQKTGEPEHALDSNEDVLITASKCIRALCQFGGFAGAEKAKKLAHFFEAWLEQHDPSHTQEELANGNSNRVTIANQKLLENGTTTETSTVSPHVYAQAWRAIGTSNAQWARLTPDAKSRPEYQTKAITNLRTALKSEYGCTDDVDTLFALALVLSERSQLGEAIQVVGAALASQRNNDKPLHPAKFSRERSLIRLWHLLALLLSAKEQFMEASHACEGAFKQFGDIKVLFGEREGDGNYQSEHLNGMQENHSAPIDNMDDYEKEALLEVKMTQLLLIEVQDGPDVAVNGTEELLSLYSRLFGQTQLVPRKSQQIPPATGTGTLRSVKGSIFGRSKRSNRDASAATTFASSMAENTSTASRPPTSQTTASAAPKIQVTGEPGTSAKLTRRSQHPSTRSTKGGDLAHKLSHASIRNRSIATSKVASNPASDGEISPTRVVDSASHQAQGALPRTAARDTNPSTSYSLLPFSSPLTRLPPCESQRHRIGMLVRVWLLIAGFYRRAEQYEDAKVSIEAASELVEGLETDILRDDSGQLLVDTREWGVGKSVEELWADVLAERGQVSLAESWPFVALSHFEDALTHFPDHPAAIVGLSNILLDISSETLVYPPSIPTIAIPPSSSSSASPTPHKPSTHTSTTSTPLGLPPPPSPGPVPATTKLALFDRLSARDRAHGLLDRLTKLGGGWNDSEAWFGLARAYEDVGMEGKAKEALWWCVQLEEARLGIGYWGSLDELKIGDTTPTAGVGDGNRAPLAKSTDEVSVDAALEAFVVGGMDEEFGGVWFEGFD
ncbi:hypothetical protein V493_03623 [Pseudogymnoascus sp. VKM F-4281 (FW-2241)]|nr:hypothetical protein V493_03623 [Pseudogymnoascus sp. VKM F-4281 (FW-2241)]